MKFLSRYTLLLFLIFSISCEGPGGKKAPEEIPPGDYTETLEESIPWLEGDEGLVVDQDIELPSSFPKPTPEKIYGEEIDDASGWFRAVTWNVRQLTELTGSRELTFHFQNSNATESLKKSDAILKSLRSFGTHIAALQEVYTPKGKEHPSNVPLTDGYGYTILEGKPIKTNAKNNSFRNEFCPIAYRAKTLKCEEGETYQSSRTHWAQCTIKGTTHTFYFGCSHLATNNGGIGGELRNMVTDLAKPYKPSRLRKPKPVVANNGATQDNFIIGMDANSHPDGLFKSAWEAFDREWQNKNPSANAVTVPGPNNGNLISKVYKRDRPPPPKIKVSTRKGRHFIDFFIRSLVRGISLKSGPTVININMLNQDKTGMELMMWHYDLSDHLPVMEDYQY